MKRVLSIQLAAMLVALLSLSIAGGTYTAVLELGYEPEPWMDAVLTACAVMPAVAFVVCFVSQWCHERNNGVQD